MANVYRFIDMEKEDKAWFNHSLKTEVEKDNIIKQLRETIEELTDGLQQEYKQNEFLTNKINSMMASNYTKNIPEFQSVNYFKKHK